MPEIARTLIIIGIVMVVGGLILLAASRLGLGRLPGDFVFRRGNFTCMVPLATSVILSILLTLALWLLRRK